jgi:hypothetical protein
LGLIEIHYEDSTTGTQWYDKQVTIYDEMHFCNCSHEKEIPTEWLTCKVRACRVLHPPPESLDPTFNLLEVSTIMEHTPPAWRAYIDVDLCHDMDALFMRVKDQEDTLLAISNLSSLHQTNDITNEVMCCIQEETQQCWFRPMAMLASSSTADTGYTYGISDMKSKRKLSDLADIVEASGTMTMTVVPIKRTQIEPHR